MLRSKNAASVVNCQLARKRFEWFKQFKTFKSFKLFEPSVVRAFGRATVPFGKYATGEVAH
jgi:hypothetical protein